MYILLNRSTLESTLRELLGGTRPEAEFRGWLEMAVVGDSVDMPAEDEVLVSAIVDWLDSSRDTSQDLHAAAESAARLLQSGLTNDEVCQILDVVRNRSRLLEVLTKLAAQQLTRTAFLSFVAEQRWPPVVKKRLAGLSTAKLPTLAETLRRKDYAVLPRLLL
jgi:hypothetical protein